MKMSASKPSFLREKLLSLFLWIECHVFFFHHVAIEFENSRPVRYYCFKCGMPFDDAVIVKKISQMSHRKKPLDR